MEQEENKWKVKVDESQKTIKQVFKKEELSTVVLKEWALEQAASALPGHLLEMRVFGPHVKLTESETQWG